MCIPHIWTSSRLSDSAQNKALFTGSILDLNISVMPATLSLFMPTMTGGFCQFPSKLKGSLIHLKRCGDLLYRLHWSQLSKRAALCGDSDPPGLPSSLLHREPSQTMGIARPHSCAGCKGRQVHLHTITTDGRIPFQLHFRSRGEKIPRCILLWLRQI